MTTEKMVDAQRADVQIADEMTDLEMTDAEIAYPPMADAKVVGEISNRRVVAVGAALFGICAAGVTYGFLGGDEPEERPVPTASVTYRITGTGNADVSYLARSSEGSATVEAGVELPWKKTVRVPLGKDPAVSIQLGRKGGEASCAVAVRGEHRQRATAFGSYGRATCTAELPTRERPEAERSEAERSEAESR
ncbi:hypothetical protein [Streptomyces sp. Je 1-332]|uniref:hypothetical protein n=1 Tax=Streptomyces sp. Je 1-332 TaxID=3231270 RepID=UPI003459C3B6